ncbi:MAG TPA: hypothetical protein VHE30_18495 [Polyangiaceae bacterium]|nr:hypothetical protein [Polyangiaceae bacterium]
MKYSIRFLAVGALIGAPIAGCVGEEPKVDQQQSETGCLTLQGRWDVKGQSCGVDTTCTIVQTGCSGSFTCDDGTKSTNSPLTVSGSSWSFIGVSSQGGAISCNGTLSADTFSASCHVPGDTCTIKGTKVGGGSGSGGSGSGGAPSGSGGAPSGSGGAPSGTGGSGVAGSGPGTCSVTFNDPTCQSCFAAQCGDSCASCQGDVECEAAIECALNCTSGSCGCRGTITDSVSLALYDAFGTCVTGTCQEACLPGGAVGDPCTVDSDCSSGTTCPDAIWCTLTCTQDADCGYASSGFQNVCILNSGNTNTCFTTCVSDLDCSSLIGTSCVLVPGTTAEYVCATSSG